MAGEPWASSSGCSAMVPWCFSAQLAESHFTHCQAQRGRLPCRHLCPSRRLRPTSAAPRFCLLCLAASPAPAALCTCPRWKGRVGKGSPFSECLQSCPVLPASCLLMKSQFLYLGMFRHNAMARMPILFTPL